MSEKNIIIRMTNQLVERFDKIVKNKGLNRSEVIRNLMNEYVEKNTK